MRSLLRRAAVPVLLLPLVAACSGGGSGPPLAVAAPAPTATPAGPGPVPDAVARNAAQAALLAESAITMFLQVTGGPTLLTARRASARSPQTTTPCTNGFSEQDTPSGQNTTHIVVSRYYDPSCASLRQRATFDSNFGIDTSDAAGAVASFDPAGTVTATQTVSDSSFASGGGFTRRLWSDTAGAAATPFGHSEAVCSLASAQCTLAAVTDGAAFETGTLLTATVPALHVSPGFSAGVPFSGSVRLGTPGTITISDAQPFAAPALSGGGTPLAVAGSVSVSVISAGLVTFSLSMDAGPTHVDAALANGVTTVTIAGGATASVNADGDGTIRYASGATEKVVDYRITG